MLALTACAQIDDSFCNEYASAWNDFAEVRDGSSATAQEVIDASKTMRDRWAKLSADEDVPSYARNMVGIAESSFMSAWTASSSFDRKAYQQSWINGRDYIARQCSEAGFDIEFNGEDVPIESPRLGAD
ncbi:hypothetical protein [Plantibacter sp. RU18]|uniref:hypothetical protein n=1 Tax=Plantibacter sp. RU18 TaxID=3158143 RepID=UPI002B95A1E1|nr:hypothetical protein [Gemmatimonadaceae bacterium]